MIWPCFCRNLNFSGKHFPVFRSTNCQNWSEFVIFGFTGQNFTVLRLKKGHNFVCSVKICQNIGFSVFLVRKWLPCKWLVIIGRICGLSVSPSYVRFCWLIISIDYQDMRDLKRRLLFIALHWPIDLMNWDC